MQFSPALGGGGGVKGLKPKLLLGLLSKKGVGREGSIESQQKTDLFLSESMPNKPLFLASNNYYLSINFPRNKNYWVVKNTKLAHSRNT